ncbi:MAG: hypothetical protein RL885_06380 [Planctomycetota bacterium]
MFAICLWLLTIPSFPAPDAAPKWLQEHMEFLAKDGGLWITDNSTYRSEQEPFDQYGIQWRYGIGEKTLHGELFGLKDGEKVATFWELLSYWDPEAKVVRHLQFGGDGTVARGTAEALEDRGEKSDETFVSPDGSKRRVGHESTYGEHGTYLTQSFDIDEEGQWTKRRLYTWKRQPAGK